jgi:hypothetical protein
MVGYFEPIYSLFSGLVFLFFLSVLSGNSWMPLPSIIHPALDLGGRIKDVVGWGSATSVGDG